MFWFCMFRHHRPTYCIHQVLRLRQEASHRCRCLSVGKPMIPGKKYEQARWQLLLKTELLFTEFSWGIGNDKAHLQQRRSRQKKTLCYRFDGVLTPLHGFAREHSSKVTMSPFKSLTRARVPDLTQCAGPLASLRVANLVFSLRNGQRYYVQTIMT